MKYGKKETVCLYLMEYQLWKFSKCVSEMVENVREKIILNRKKKNLFSKIVCKIEWKRKFACLVWGKKC